MIKRLKLFGTSTVQKKLKDCQIDKNHQMVNFNMFNHFLEMLNNQRQSKELFDKIRKNISSDSNPLKIKTLILLHYLLKKTFDQKLILLTQQLCSTLQLSLSMKLTQQRQNSLKQTVKLQNQQKQYIQKNIIQFYLMYLKKFIAYQQSYEFAKKQDQSDDKNKKPISYFQSKFKEESFFLQCVNHGFKIVNLVNFVLQSQESFNKMGRYYIQQYEIISLFVMYLSDLSIYNGFIKKLSKRIIKLINQLQPGKVKHCFLFLTQAQKVSDRLYEFHYNRYYYSIIKKHILMPTFLTVQNQEFDKVVKEIKKVDKQLFLLVKQSKYTNNNTNHKLNQTCITQPNRRKHNIDRNKTMMTQASQRINQISSQWENITRYIEQVDEVDQKQQYI